MQLIKGMTIAAASALVVAMSYGCSSTTTIITDDGGTGTDSGPGVDAGKKDTGGGGMDANNGGDTGPMPGQCTPGDVSSFNPTYIPAIKPAMQCSTQVLTDFFTACIDPGATGTTCQTWQKANTSCNSCIITDSTAASWGPLVQIGNSLKNFAGTYLNISGCYEAQGVPTSCAQNIQFGLMCDAAACPVPSDCAPTLTSTGMTDMGAQQALQSCYQAADMLPKCGGYAMNASCVSDDGGPHDMLCENPALFSGTTATQMEQDAALKAFIAVFCGGG